MATIVFDFDGTIADSFDFVVDFLSDRSKKKHKLTPTQRKKLRGLSMIAIAYLLGHHRHQLAGLFFKGRKDMRSRMHKVKPVKGMPEVISSLANDGHKLFIVTNNSASSVESFLKTHQLRQHFYGVHGNAWRTGKASALARLARRNGDFEQDIHYIGDEPKDIRAANYLSARSIGVTWGFCSKEKIEENRPTAVVDRPQEILSVINDA